MGHVPSYTLYELLQIFALWSLW